MKVLALLFLLAFAIASGSLLNRHDGGEGLLESSGALRVFVMDAVWMRMAAHLHEGNERLVLSDARTLLELEPESPGIRYFLHWFLALTMAHKAVTDEEKVQWIVEGLTIMDEGLEQDPDSFVLNRGLGMTFFVRTEAHDESFDRVCVARYGSLPAQLAWPRFRKALETRDDEDTRLFGTASLVNAARFEMEMEEYGTAAGLWRELIDAIEDLEPRFLDLAEYCSLMAREKKSEEMSPADVKKIEELSRRLKEDRFGETEQ